MQMTSTSDWRRPINKYGNKWTIKVWLELDNVHIEVNHHSPPVFLVSSRMIHTVVTHCCHVSLIKTSLGCSNLTTFSPTPKLNQTASKELRGLLSKPSASLIYCFLISEIQLMHFGNFNTTTSIYYCIGYMCIIIGVISRGKLSLLIKLSFMKMAEFVEAHWGGKALQFEGYAYIYIFMYSKIRDGKMIKPLMWCINSINFWCVFFNHSEKSISKPISMARYVWETWSVYLTQFSLEKTTLCKYYFFSGQGSYVRIWSPYCNIWNNC